jgi:hypothetical protein
MPTHEKHLSNAMSNLLFDSLFCQSSTILIASFVGLLHLESLLCGFSASFYVANTNEKYGNGTFWEQTKMLLNPIMLGPVARG